MKNFPLMECFTLNLSHAHSNQYFDSKTNKPAEKWSSIWITNSFVACYLLKLSWSASWNLHFGPSNIPTPLSKIPNLDVIGKRAWSTSSLMLGIFFENVWIIVKKTFKTAGTPMLSCWNFQNISKCLKSKFCNPIYMPLICVLLTPILNGSDHTYMLSIANSNCV